LHRFCLIHPCDGRTDGQTDRRTELRWLRRAIAVPAVARKKRIMVHFSKRLRQIDSTQIYSATLTNHAVNNVTNSFNSNTAAKSFFESKLIIRC